jgi:hypothetical protein
MAFNKHDLGDLIRVTGVFRLQSTGGVIDPTNVFLSILDPDEGLTTYQFEGGTDDEIIKDSVGTYHADIDAIIAGTWYYRWFSTGVGQAAIEGRFVIRAAYAVDVT